NRLGGKSVTPVTEVGDRDQSCFKVGSVPRRTGSPTAWQRRERKQMGCSESEDSPIFLSRRRTPGPRARRVCSPNRGKCKSTSAAVPHTAPTEHVRHSAKQHTQALSLC